MIESWDRGGDGDEIGSGSEVAAGDMLLVRS